MIQKLILGFIVKNLILLHKGTLFVKLNASVKLGIGVAPVAFIVEKLTDWTVENAVYIGWVLWAIFVDWVVGVWYHIKKKDFDWGKNALGLTLKIGMALFAGSLFEALPYFLKHDNIIAQLLLVVTRLAVFLYPAGSAFMNMAEITDGKFPPTGWIKKIKYFNENLNLKPFKEDFGLEEEKKEEQQIENIN